MREAANERQVDFVVVDTGDLVTGHGISDATSPRGKLSNQLIAEADYDVLTIGNHELYEADALEEMRRHFIPRWSGRYLTSNVEVNDSNTKIIKPIGERWTSFKLSQSGRRLTAFGILFNFTSPLQQVQVTSPADMVLQPWFLELMISQLAAETDVWLVAAHMPLDQEQEDQWNTVLTALRHYIGPHKPIIGLGGHTHVRNCRMYDSWSMMLQSGRFHETAGWLSFTWPSVNNGLSFPSFSRRYIDVNPLNLARHLGQSWPSSSIFNFPKADGVRQTLRNIVADRGLDEVHGFAPKDFFLERFPAHHEHSILNGTRHVLRDLFAESHRRNNDASNHSNWLTVSDRLVILNSGSLRADLRRGPFTTNDQFVVSPFSDEFFVLPEVPRRLAERLVHSLNTVPMSRSESEDQLDENVVNNTNSAHAPTFDSRADVSPGYVTVDTCGSGGRQSSDGDDTLHSQIPKVPFEPPYLDVFIKGRTSEVQNETLQEQTSEAADKVDIITVNYLLDRITIILTELDKAHYSNSGRHWQPSQAQNFCRLFTCDGLSDGTLHNRDLWKLYARKHWNRSHYCGRCSQTSICSVLDSSHSGCPEFCASLHSHWQREWQVMQVAAEANGHEIYRI